MLFAKKLLAVCLLAFFFTGFTSAQEISTGLDFVSKYIWRGAEAGSGSPSLQPTLKYTNSGFQFGFWGATPLTNTNGNTEIDIFTGYTFTLANSATIGILVNDYTYPSSGVRYGNFNNYDDPDGAGAHQLEASLSYTGPESFPLSVSANSFFHCVKNNPVYFEVGYSAAIKETPVKLFAGLTTGDDALYYGAKKFAVVNLGFTATKTVKVTESFSFPLFTTVALNPATEKIFLVVGISL